MKEYNPGTEPEHVLQDAMGIISKYKRVEELVLMYNVENDQGEIDSYRHVLGETYAVIGLIEVTKSRLIQTQEIEEGEI